MDIQQFKKLKVLAEKDLQFDEKNVLQMSEKVPNLFQRYLDIYVEELKVLKGMELDREKMYGDLYKHFKYNDSYEWNQKGEIESQINSNDEYNKLKIKMAQQEFMVKYLESVLDNIKRLSFSIKNWIEIKKFQAGMF